MMRYLCRNLAWSGLAFVFCIGALPQEAWAACRYKNRRVKWYVVQPGDSCWSISLKLFGTGKKYRVIHRYNDLGKQPHILKPGSRLCFPQSTQDPDARILWKRRNAEAKPPRTADWRGAYRRMALWSLYNVRTRTKSMAKLKFLNQSSLLLRELSRIIIYGSSAQKIRRRTFSSRTIEVKQGVVRGGLASLDGGSDATPKKKKKRKPMVLKTPAGRVELNSTSAQVEYNKGKKTSVVSVYQGVAKVKARGKSVRVPKDFGTYVKKGKPPAKPKPLPKAPVWQDQKQAGVGIVVPGRQMSSYTVRWNRVPRGMSYRLDWSRWSDFQDVVGSVVWSANPHRKGKQTGRVTCHATRPECTLHRLRPGQTYFVRVSARDYIGMEGRFSKSFQINVIKFQMKTPQKMQGGAYLFAGWLNIMPPLPQAIPKPPKVTKYMSRRLRGRVMRRYKARVKLTRMYNEALNNLEVSLGSKGSFRSLKKGIQLLGPKQTLVRIRIGGQPSNVASFRVNVLKVTGQLAGPQQPLQWKSQPPSFTLQVLDSTKRRVFIPGVSVKAYPGGILKLTSGCSQKGNQDIRGCYRVTLPKFKKSPGPSVWVVARWPGGELARQKVVYKASVIKGSLTAPQELRVKQKKQVTLSILEDNRPPSEKLEGLVIQSYPGGVLKLQAKGKGRYVAALPAFEKAPSQNIWVVASWRGGELARKSISFKVPDRRFVWPEMPASMEWSLSGPGLPSRGARPVSMVGLTSFAQGTPPAADASTDVALRLSLRGQLAFWKNRIGVDMDLPWLQMGLLQDGANQNRLGDFRLGARFVAYERKKLLVTPTLRLRLPTGGLPRPRKDMTFEPGVILAWKPIPILHINTNQILALSTDFNAPVGLYYTSSYSLSVRPWKFLSVGLEFNMALGLLEPNQSGVAVGLGLGGAVKFHFDRFRLGVVGGGALNDDGRRLLGGFTAGITFDVGFRGL